MVKSIGTGFPLSWQYGPEEQHIFHSTVRQVDVKFANERNLVINTTWFGSQFDNGIWQQALELQGEFDNLFLLSVIDPLYLSFDDLETLVRLYKIKKVYRIGMFENSKHEWNFHAIVGKDLMPRYTEEEVLLRDLEYVYMLYQRKPRQHRVEITNLLRDQDLLQHGIVTLGSPGDFDWHRGLTFTPICIEDSADNYKHNGSKQDFGGVPNDLVTLGRLDLWQKHFLNIVSETVFDEWEPLLVTEKMWKPMIGLRPFLVHGNPKTYAWLRNRGFRTFNQYWPHIAVEEVYDGFGPHDAVTQTIKFLADFGTEGLIQMYRDMAADLTYNKARFYEFSQEQTYRMENIFE